MKFQFARKNYRIIVGLFLGIFLLQSMIAGWDETLTFDATCYVGLGYQLLKTRDFTLENALFHPPLSFYLSGWPLFFYENNYSGDIDAACTDLSNKIIFGSKNPEFVMMLSKLPFMLLFALMGYFIFRWTKEIYNINAGLLALFLFSFSPLMIGNSKLVSTDSLFTVFAFISMYYFWKFMKEINNNNFILWTVFSSLTFVSKVTAVYMIPAVIFMAVLTIYKNKFKNKGFINFKYFKERRINHAFNWFVYFALWLVLIFVFVIPLFYMFQPYSFFDLLIEEKQVRYPNTLKDLTEEFVPSNTVDYFVNDFRTPWNAYFYTFFDFGILHSLYGHDAFLLGQYSDTGWWYYFIVAFLIKTSLSVIILLIIRKFQFFYNEKRFDDYFLLIPLVFFFLPFLFANINVGIRHVLQIYPFIFVFAGGVVFLLKNKAFRFILALLLLGHAASSLAAFPYHVSYFNEITLGEGYEWLSDSNLDWGQDLGRLANYFEENGIDHVNIAYFGTVDPSYYGINYSLLPPFDDLGESCRKVDGHIAISATHLQGVYLENHNCFDWLKKEEPVERIGSIFVYEIG